jgi:hypothetical protein
LSPFTSPYVAARIPLVFVAVILRNMHRIREALESSTVTSD